MEKSIKRFINCCLLAGTMLLCLSACGQAPQQSQAHDQGQTGQDSSSGEDAQTPNTALPGESESMMQSGEGNVLVVYFSATGSTQAVAEYISEELDAELYEIVPEDPYSSDDLDWGNSSSRVNAEHEDIYSRPTIVGGTIDLSNYDTIFLGYPLWWREAPNIVRTFLESNNLSGKTVIPFCTSTSDGIGSSGETLQAFAPDATWIDGKRFTSRVDESDVIEWVNGLDITE